MVNYFVTRHTDIWNQYPRARDPHTHTHTSRMSLSRRIFFTIYGPILPYAPNKYLMNWSHDTGVLMQYVHPHRDSPASQMVSWGILSQRTGSELLFGEGKSFVLGILYGPPNIFQMSRAFRAPLTLIWTLCITGSLSYDWLGALLFA